jgi:hypothetical protein
MTLYLDLPDPRGKLDLLISQFGAEVLPGPPGGLDEVPPDKALICVADMGKYEAAGYIVTETEFASWTDPPDGDVKTWLLLDRAIADRLCPDAAEHYQHWQSAVERDAEAAAHTDNLIPVARASRSALQRDARLLREYAAALRGEQTGARTDRLLADAGMRRAAAADLDGIARNLDSWLERDWVAVIDIGPGREHLAGPLPPFPESGQLA